MWYFIVGFICMGIGAFFGGFMVAAGHQNKEWDAFNEGYRKAIEDIKTGKKVLK